MKNTTRLILCLLLALALSFSSCIKQSPSDVSGEYSDVTFDDSSVVSTGDENSGEEPEFLRNGVYFKDLSYERPDFDAIYAKINHIDTLYQSSADAGVVYDEFESLVDMMWEANTAYGLLNIYQSLDTADSVIAGEMVVVSESFTKVQQSYYILAEKLLDSSYSDTLFGDLSDAEKDEIRFNAYLFDDEFVALSAKLTELENKYIDSMSLTVFADGKEITLQDVLDTYGYSSYIKAFNLAAGKLYLEIVDIYKAITKKAGFSSYADFAYKSDYYRDYTPGDSKKLHGYVSKYITPLFTAMSKKVSYYDSKKKNSPFDNEEVLTNYFNTVSPDMVNAFKFMKKYGLYSIESGENRQQGAYTTFLNSYDIPFIFQNISDDYSDIQTFIHEFGHFYAYYLHGEDLPFMIDIDEIHSQANELLFLPYFEDIYGSKAAKTISMFTIYSNLGSVISGCLFDEFEQLVFAGDYDSVDELNLLFEDLCEKYQIPYSQYDWVRVHHLFLYPFYYISYATSLIPSFEIYAHSVNDRDGGIGMYNSLMAKSVNAGGFMALLESSGFSNPFDEKTIKDIAETISALNK
jgi:hypothetical protein